MRINMKFIAYLVVAAGCSAAHAGSYEDYFSAIVRDDPREVRTLLQRGFDPNTTDPKGLHGLYLALRQPSPKVAETLIDWPRTNIEVRTEKDESPLMMAALKGHLGLAKKLIDKDAHVNKPGWAPLHYAATGGHIELMKLLLEHHAFIDAESPNGTTPLMMAAMYGTAPAVKLLLDEGADTAMKNMQGMTAVDFATRANRKDVADMILAATRAKGPKGKW